ncbi:MAG: hypothetical protein ACRELY_14345, partial [Polyangiaceae bacterium]
LLWSMTLYAQTDDPPETLAQKAVAALRGGHPAEAIADFESLADRGVVDANMSFDRGLAYAERVRVGGEQPGDLGNAAQGFEEARTLTRDSALREQCARALAVIRTEVGHRRSRAGHPADLEQTPILREAIVGAISEDAWCVLALFASIATSAAFYVRWLTKERRREVAANVAIAISVPILAATVIAAVAAREMRMHRVEAVVVSASARPSNASGIALPNAEPVPEGARVRVMAENAGWEEIRWGALDAWVPASDIRMIERPASE